MKSEIAREILNETPIDIRKELSEHWELVILQSNPMKLNIEQLKDILHAVKQIQESFNKLRFGQALWSFLAKDYPGITNKYWDTTYDCFYVDAIVLSLFELILDDTAAQYWYETQEFKDLVDEINSNTI